MQTKTIIETLGGAAALAREIGLPDGDASAKVIRAWAFRDSIPSEWFAAVARAAAALGHPEITEASLAAQAEARRLHRSGRAA